MTWAFKAHDISKSAPSAPSPSRLFAQAPVRAFDVQRDDRQAAAMRSRFSSLITCHAHKVPATASIAASANIVR